MENLNHRGRRLAGQAAFPGRTTAIILVLGVAENFAEHLTTIIY